MAGTQNLLSGMPLVLKTIPDPPLIGTVYYLIMNNLVPNCPNSYAPLKAVRPTWTVYFIGLVASYDTHIGTRWLNSNPKAT